MSYEDLSLRLVGVSPLLLHNGQLANPAYSFTRELKAITAKRRKTDADLERIAYLEWLGGLYFSPKLGICIPGEVIEAAFVQAARRLKKGPQARAGLVCEDLFALGYDGPRDVEALWRDERFRLTIGVRVQGTRVMRTRPRFPAWSLDVSVRYLPDILDAADVREIFAVMGRQIGIGDWRPRYGRFEMAEAAAPSAAATP